jgi:hypothetical protein
MSEASTFAAWIFARALSGLPRPARLPAFGRNSARFTLDAEAAAAVAEFAELVALFAGAVAEPFAAVADACAPATAAATSWPFVGSIVSCKLLREAAERDDAILQRASILALPKMDI